MVWHGVLWYGGAGGVKERWCSEGRGRGSFAGSSQGGRSERLLLVNLPHTLKKHKENHSERELLTIFIRPCGFYLLDIHVVKDQISPCPSRINWQILTLFALQFVCQRPVSGGAGKKRVQPEGWGA